MLKLDAKNTKFVDCVPKSKANLVATRAAACMSLLPDAKDSGDVSIKFESSRNSFGSCVSSAIYSIDSDTLI